MLVRVKCLRNTTDSSYKYFNKDEEHTVPMDHPCMKHFEKLEEIRESDAESERGAEDAKST